MLKQQPRNMTQKELTVSKAPSYAVSIFVHGLCISIFIVKNPFILGLLNAHFSADNNE